MRGLYELRFDGISGREVDSKGAEKLEMNGCASRCYDTEEY